MGLLSALKASVIPKMAWRKHCELGRGYHAYREDTYILDVWVSIGTSQLGRGLLLPTYWRALGHLRPCRDSSNTGLERQLLGRRLAQRRAG